MIKLNGYFKSNPMPYQDSVANRQVEGYFHNAYLFLADGKYLRATKRTKFQQMDFSKSDFNSEFSNKYVIRDSKLEMFFETGTEWEFSEIFEISSPEELKGKELTLRFVSW